MASRSHVLTITPDHPRRWGLAMRITGDIFAESLERTRSCPEADECLLQTDAHFVMYQGSRGDIL